MVVTGLDSRPEDWLMPKFLPPGYLIADILSFALKTGSVLALYPGISITPSAKALASK
jgi:hypothetical protein